MKNSKIVILSFLISLILTPVFTSAQVVAPTDGLVGHWTFDEGSGGIAGDSVGTNTGTLINGPTWVVGKIGQALQFDGVDYRVDLGNSTALDNLGPVTYSVWVKSNVSNSNQDILIKGFSNAWSTSKSLTLIRAQ